MSAVRTPTGWTDYRAVSADSRPRALPDGSSIQLYAGSELKVRTVAGRRDAGLIQGGGMFRIWHDSDHPFRVTTEYAAFEDVGTAFNLLLKDDVAGVYVIEGSVRASGKRGHAVLHMGDAADVLSSGVVNKYPDTSQERDAGPVALLRATAAFSSKHRHLPGRTASAEQKTYTDGLS